MATRLRCSLGYRAPMRVAAIVLAAGRGERLGANVPKAFVCLAGRSLVARSIEALTAVPEIDLVVPVLPADELERWARQATERLTSPRLAAPVAGGAQRQDSMAAGLAALPDDVAFVAVHDAARPLVRPADVSRVIAVARAHGAALLVGPISDTVKRVCGDVVEATLERATLRSAQTPQVARIDWLREGIAKAQADGVIATDDAQLLERLGLPVHVVEGDPGNRKITHADDLAAAEAELRRRGELA